MEKINTLKPSYKVMGGIFKQCLVINGSKPMLFVLLNMVLSSIVYSIAFSPLYVGVMGGAISFGSIIFSGVLAFAAGVFDFIMFYGLQVSFSRMVEKKEVTMGHLFCGFRERTGKVFKESLLLTGITVAFLMATTFLAYNLMLKNGVIDLNAIAQQDTETVFNMISQSSMILTLVVIGTIAVVRVPVIYLWIVLYRRNDLGIFRAIQISASLLFRQFFRFVGFVFYSAGKDLIVLVVVVLVNLFVPGNVESMGYSLFLNLLSFIQLIQEFKVLVRIFFAIPIYFYSMTGVLQVQMVEQNLPADENSDDDSENDSENRLPADSADFSEDSGNEN